MKSPQLFLTTLVGLAAAAHADTLQLKDAASVTGTILAEKRDAVVVDMGYTALVIPQNQIVKILRDEKTEPTKPKSSGKNSAALAIVAEPKISTPAETKVAAGLYSLAAKVAPVRAVRDLVNVLGEAVVQVRTPGGLGSGFILDEDGFLITNFHVIEGETQISIEVYHQKDEQIDRKTYKQVRIVALNKFADLVLLRIEDKDAPKFAHIALGDDEALATGEHVFAIGSPLGFERTVTEGIVSTKTRQMQGDLYLQTTAQINSGNSGGPLFNMSGDVVGVTNMKITMGEGLGFAIPVTAVKYFLDHRDAFAYSNENPSNPYRYLEPPSRTKLTVEAK
ncbi:MAG: putative serine protease HhoB precursor [Verrucomicrobiota bacterium]|jgi:serine protease Do